MIGLQLYTIRDQMTNEASCKYSLQAVREMGYECVQLAGKTEHVELSASVCAEIGLPVCGILVNPEQLEGDKAERIFEAARVANTKNLAISGYRAKNLADAEELIRFAQSFVPKALERGFTFAYHNHSNEWIVTENGKKIITLLDEQFPEEAEWMPDTYWLQHAGEDVCRFLRESKRKFPILHLKDMKRGLQGPTFAELGKGNLNLPGILAAAKEKHVEFFVVEQDVCEQNSMESAKYSLETLKKLL